MKSQFDAEKELLAKLTKEYPAGEFIVDIWSEGDGAAWRGSGARVYKITKTGRIGKKVAGGSRFMILNK